MGGKQLNAAKVKSDSHIRGVVVDFGEVMSRRPALDKLGRMAAAVGLDTATFKSRYDRDRALYDRGDLSPRDYWSKVAPDSVELNDGLLNKLRQWDLEIWSDIDPEMTEWLARVRAAGFKTALLSNMHSDMALHVRRSFSWLKCLDCSVLSCEVRLIKPDPAIYQRCLQCLQLHPSEALFIDDREVNVHAASAAGLVALQFASVDLLRKTLAGLSFPVLPVNA